MHHTFLEISFYFIVMANKNQYWLRSNDDFLSHLLLDEALTAKEKSVLLANSINDNVIMYRCCTISLFRGQIVPICFSQQELKQLYFETTPDNDIKIVKIMFTEDAKEADVLLAEDVTYDDFTGRETTRCRIYFSEHCSKDMAATAYFCIKALSLVPEAHFSNKTLLQLGSQILKRYGKRLTPHSFSQFWRDQLLQILQDSIYFRDRLLKNKNENVSSLYSAYNDRIKQQLQRQKLIDVYYKRASNRLHYLIEIGKEPHTMTGFVRMSVGPLTKRRMRLSIRNRKQNRIYDEEIQ